MTFAGKTLADCLEKAKDLGCQQVYNLGSIDDCLMGWSNMLEYDLVSDFIYAYP